MLDQIFIRKVAVLGAGVMGAQIGAHFANAGIPLLLYDLKALSGPANANAEKALANLAKIHPRPLAARDTSAYITLANYDDDLEQLSDCDLIIEAIAERLDWKVALFHKIAAFVSPQTILASNTSGLSIEELAASLPLALQSNFCGIHFFNPPRYMPLVEIIPHTKSAKQIIPQLEAFLVTSLGKSVIQAKDTPNFMANRIGVFSLLSALEYAEKFRIPFEVIDQLTGKNLGRASSATFRTADVVGLDTFAQVVATMAAKCKDGFEAAYQIPSWLQALIKAGALGQKTQAGIYKKDSQWLLVIDPDSGCYRLASAKAAAEVLAILKLKTWTEKLAALHASSHPQAKFLWSTLRDLFHYCAILIGEIADTPRAIDLAMRWGFGWTEGPFEIWQQAGWLEVANWIKADIAAGSTISQQALPAWVFAQSAGVYVAGKHFSINHPQLLELNLLPVYQRQIFPDLVLGESLKIVQSTLYENEGVKLWHSGDNIGILSFKTKMCSIGMSVLIGLEQAIAVAVKECSAMVIWQEQDLFSVGANLEEFGLAIRLNGAAAANQIITLGQRVIAQKIRYSPIPIVAAVRGYAFGGGCEIMLHCAAVVAALESSIGLVEAGVGLLPAWGGSSEMAIRAAQSLDSAKDLSQRYQNLAQAKASSSAREAMEMGFLRESDSIVMNSREVLLVAKKRAEFLSLSGYRPPLPPQLQVLGEQGIANLQALLTNLQAGKQISEHDHLIALSIAEVLNGGQVSAGSMVNHDWLLNLEKQKFTQLALSAKTAARIQYMLAHGKPLRN